MPSAALQFFLSAPRDVVVLETLELSHPGFTKTYWLVRNSTRDGIDVTIESGVVQHFDFYPMQITELSDQADLDTGIRIDLGDLGEVLPAELDSAYQLEQMGIKPEVTYRAYRSDDLTTPLIGPLLLEARTFTFAREGCSFEAGAPYVNLNKTGETYNLTRFYMLRGFVK